MYLGLNIVLHSCEKVLGGTVICLKDHAFSAFKISGVGS